MLASFHNFHYFKISHATVDNSLGWATAWLYSIAWVGGRNRCGYVSAYVEASEWHRCINSSHVPSLLEEDVEWHCWYIPPSDHYFNGCYGYENPSGRDFYLKLSCLFCIHVITRKIHTLISYHLQVSDNFDKWLEKRFSSLWLMDVSHFVTLLITGFLNRAAFFLLRLS
jgi:hypothetical protein